VSETDDIVKDIAAKKLSPIYLVVGEEFLARKSADEIVRALVPDASVGLNLAILDGGSPKEIAQELATMPLFPGRKVALVRDPEFLAPKKGRTQPLGKALDAWRAGRKKEAARRVLALAARAGWGADQLDPTAPGAPDVEAWSEELNVELADADLAFLKEVAAFCKEERITAPESDVGILLSLFERGVPDGHALVIAATDVDPKNPLVKFAGEKGELVERKVAAKLDKLEIGDLVAEVLGPLGKKLSPAAEKALKLRVGGNMRLMQSELEKLAVYAEGKEIKPADVELLVAHAREEEYFDLAKALQERDLAAAMKYVDEAFAQDVHGLQILGAIASIVRGLLENRERLTRLGDGPPPRNPNDFERRFYPAIEREAQELGKKPPHPYAAFKSFEAAARYSRKELLDSLLACAEADLALKSSAPGRLVIERLLWTVCGRVG
jgi:DNA polymerase-3 subunit delta